MTDSLSRPFPGVRMWTFSQATGKVCLRGGNSTAASYSSGAYTGLNDLNKTVYGVHLLSLLRIYGFARYIP